MKAGLTAAREGITVHTSVVRFETSGYHRLVVRARIWARPRAGRSGGGLHATAGLAITAVVYGCVVGPKHPGNPGFRPEVCAALCAKMSGCGAPIDRTACENDCQSRLNPRMQYDRPDFIASIKECVARTMCGSNLRVRLGHDCLWVTEVSLVPSPLAHAACERRLEKTQYCVMTSVSVEKCLEQWKMYTDPILADLDACADDRICSNYGRCIRSVVGADVFWDDRDRAKEQRERPVAEAPPTRVHLGGTANVAEAPWPGITLCVEGHPEIPCSTTGADGRFAVPLPASSEVTITARGPGLASIVFAVSTATHDIGNLRLSFERVDIVVSRYEGAGMQFPNAGTGAILVTALGPGRMGASGITLSTPSGGRTVYLSRDGRPRTDLGTTSESGRAVVIEVPPGVAEIQIGPESALCSPMSGWAGQGLNRVRVPVLAGHETRVAVRCAP